MIFKALFALAVLFSGGARAQTLVSFADALRRQRFRDQNHGRTAGNDAGFARIAL